MAPVRIKRVSSWRDRRLFIDLPWSLYRDDPNWVPPIRSSQPRLLGYRSHPFDQQGEIQTFLAFAGQRPVGRIAAIVNRAHNRLYQDRLGFFGFFETEADPAVARALFDAAFDWLGEHGLSTMRGPVNPSMNYVSGLLIDGFDSPPTFSLPYNPAYYCDLVEDYGFRKAHDLLAFVGYKHQLPLFEQNLEPLVDQAQERFRPVIRPLHTGRRHADLAIFLDLFNRSFEGMWGFVPITRSELDDLVGSLRYLISPELALIAEIDGRPAGAVIGLPDYNPCIKAINGRLFPFGFLRLIAKRDLRRICVLTLNVAPEFQRWGLGLVLLRALIPKALELGIEEADFAWIAESNRLALRGMQKAGVQRGKTYRIYDCGQGVVAPACPAVEQTIVQSTAGV